VKVRVVGRQQQIVRVDFETAPEAEVLAAHLDEYERLLPDCDWCCCPTTARAAWHTSCG